MKKLTMLLVLTVAVTLSSLASAAIPHLINYQGRLTDPSGSPVADGAYNITFRIYDDPNAGTLLWEEAHTGVQVQKGIFGIMLGSVTSLNLAFDKPYYLEMVVAGEVMTPRQQITSAGYAFRAEMADTAKTADKAITIESRTSDPSSPTTGQIWLRTDL